MKRGEIWWVDFDPSKGGEITKRRPAIIISNDASNHALNRLQVVPITSNASKLYPSEAFVAVNGQQCKAMADQLTTVSKQRLSKRIGTLKPTEVSQIEHAIMVQLGFALHTQ